ncbi:hypothetical protein [Dyella mobilis]|uniref:Uncharacterized protein n=1 Tax=Dyella mobilis TaxID=1849582 RepID=A0ABS2KL48_9GAMM|nr:hypothetical protein [Dyella mobilis]MBM7131502.1 hypothetical protein [Dyella mobilis]GLQ96527.1 hypothetical protein GCM10007863_09450 [Dyella mobilis]
MNAKAPGAWITLNASYYLPPVCDPLKLLDDATLLLDGAQGMARVLSDVLPQVEDLNQVDLANAMFGIATLIEMGQSSAQEANRRLSRLREKVWRKEKAEQAG